MRKKLCELKSWLYKYFLYFIILFIVIVIIFFIELYMYNEIGLFVKNVVLFKIV